jgi:TolB protein
MSRYRRHAVGLGLVLVASLASAQATDLTITKTGAAKSSIDLSGMKPGGGEPPAVFMRTLENDLKLSGWFVIAPAGRGSIVVEGTCDASGSRLTARCSVRSAGAALTYLSETFPGDADKARRLAHTVADAIVLAVRKVPGIASTRIAMIGRGRGGKDVFLCDADGGALTQITQDGSACLAPIWEPDATALIYTSLRSGYPDIYRIDLVSNRRTRIVAFPGLNLGGDVSPSGRELALTLSKDGNPELYVMGVGGGSMTRITRTPRAAEASPSWSPDGSRIVFVSDQAGSPQLYIMSAQGGSPRRITFRGSENVAPDWGPDGRIAYVTRRGNYQVCVMDASGGDGEPLTQDAADHEDPSWAPDSRHIAYTKTSGYRPQVYILDTMGDPEVRLSPLSGEWASPQWSPK